MLEKIKLILKLCGFRIIIEIAVRQTLSLVLKPKRSKYPESLFTGRTEPVRRGLCKDPLAFRTGISEVCIISVILAPLCHRVYSHHSLDGFLLLIKLIPSNLMKLFFSVPED